MKVFGIIVTAILLVGCGGPMVFARDGAGDEELKADGYACHQQWEQSAGAIAFRLDPIRNAYFGFKAKSDYIECLESKGWVRVE